jgi:predicted XRE-type DNA-binding protein
LIGTLLAFGNNPLEVDLLNARIKGQDFSNARAEQEIEGTVPLTPYQKEQLEIQKDNARREEERLRLDQNQDARAEQQAAASAEAAKNAERRAEESIRFASAANTRAEKQAAASAEAAIERSRVDQLANEGISIFNKGEDGFNKFLETLSPQDQGVVLTEVKQFRDKTPAESKLTAGAIADIMMKRDGNKGPTFGEYLSKLRQASNKGVKKTDDKYVVKGLWNDIDKIPAFEELIRQFPQFKVLPDEGQETRTLPNGGVIVVKSTQ